MKLKTFSLSFLALIFVLTSSVKSQSLSTSDSIDVFIKAKMEQRKIPALQLAILGSGKILKNTTYGIANLENEIKATDKTLFSINSITKAFVGVAIMQLAEEQKLNIKDPLAKHIKNLPASWQKITIQQVLTHTSGLPDIINEEEQVIGHGDEKEAMDQIIGLPVEFQPGEKFRYNQTGYVLLGQIITKLSGMHFTAFIEERQFKPAGMTSTRFGDSYDVIPNSAGAYTLNKQIGNQFVRNNTPGIAYMQFPVFFRTAAGILSTATDMSNWIIALKTGKLLKQPQSLETMWTPAILNNGKIGGFNRLNNGYALGWPTVSRDEHPAVGPVGGGRSVLFIYLKDDLSIVVLTNLMGSNPEQFIDEIAGYYIPELHEANGFGLPKSIKKLRAELLNKGYDKAIPIAAQLKKKDANFILDENDLNGWGYELLAQKKPNDAIQIFKLNTSLFPKSSNAYDSLAEALEVKDRKAEALLNYRISLKLDPQNKHAADRIILLEGK